MLAVLWAQKDAMPPPPPPIPWWAMFLVVVLSLVALIAVLFAFRVASHRRGTTNAPSERDFGGRLSDLQERVEDLERDLRDLRRQLPTTGPEDRIAAK